MGVEELQPGPTQRLGAHKSWLTDTEGPQKNSRDPQNHESKTFVFVGPKTFSLLNSTLTVSTPTRATLPANTFPSIFSAIYVEKPYFCGSLVLTNADPRNDPQTFCKSKFRFHTRLPPPTPPPFLLRSTTPCAVPALSVISTFRSVFLLTHLTLELKGLPLKHLETID